MTPCQCVGDGGSEILVRAAVGFGVGRRDVQCSSEMTGCHLVISITVSKFGDQTLKKLVHGFLDLAGASAGVAWFELDAGFPVVVPGDVDFELSFSPTCRTVNVGD